MLSAIVLAAGQSARFGRCKQLLRIGGKPLLEHVLDYVRGADVDDVVVVLGASAEEIQREVRFERERIVVNPRYADGMSTSIQSALRALAPESEAAMIVLGDQPFVATQTLDALIHAWRRTRAGIIVPTFGGARGNPVIVDRMHFAEMMEIRGDVGFRALFGRHAVATVDVDDRGILTDIDTMEDFDVA